MIYEYIKNIMLIAIFLALIEMILPNQKFSKYIKLVLGFVLMLNIVLPFVDFKKYSFELKNFEELNFYDEKFDYSPYVDASNNISNETVDYSIKKAIRSLFVSSDYMINDISFEYEIISNIRHINSIYIILEEKATNDVSNKKSSVDYFSESDIKINKIKVSGLSKNNVSNTEENKEIIDFKNLISMEYNLSKENIYVNIKD